MMSVSPGMSAGQAGGYFSREDYYLKGAEAADHSRWCGTGAEGLELSGPVREADFRALCEGRHPGTGERIVLPKITRDDKTGEPVLSHRAGNDCTFSAPKSVSIAYAAGVPGIKEAHDQAVLAVLEHMEAHYSHYRSPDGIKSGRFLAAKFDHATSRNLDPQLHSHVFVLNVVETGDGIYQANEPKAIFQDQKSLGLLYRQELVYRLRQRGFGISLQDRSQMFFELSGVDPGLCVHFSSRRPEIEAQVALWKTEEKYARVRPARLYEMAGLETRDAKRELSREDVLAAFESGFESYGTSSLRVKKDLEDSIRLPVPADNPEPFSPSGYTAREAVRLAAQSLTDKEAVLDRARFLDESIRISGGSHAVRELNAAIEEGAIGIERLGQDYRGREWYSTNEMRRLEGRNLAVVKALAGTFKSITSAAEINAFLEKLGREEGIRLTPGQQDYVVNELVGEHGVAVTQGDPGTGKTFSSKIVERFNAEVLLPQGKEHFTVNLAFTGKAAQEMSLASGRPSFTIDSFLNAYGSGRLRREGEAAPIVSGGEAEWIIPRGAQVAVKVDEVSFVGARQAEHLLQVVKDLQGQGVQAKLQLTGDTKQMQAIQAGDLFRQVQKLAREGQVSFVHLTEINRQKNEELLQVAEILNREGFPLAENAKVALALLRDQGAVVEKTERGDLVRCAVEEYMAASREPSPDPGRREKGTKQSVLLVTSTNEERRELNREIRSARIAAGELETGIKCTVLIPAVQGVTADRYIVGQSVVFSGYRDQRGKMQPWGARLYTEGKITATNREENTVTVSYPLTTRGEAGEKITRQITKTLPAAEMALKTIVYNREERSFASGDRIVALKNDKGLGVQNGLLGEIQSVTDAGVLQVNFSGRTVELHPEKYNHLDHAYAVTIHKSQGATVEHAIMFSYLKPLEETSAPRSCPEPEAEAFGRASYNALNVAITRAQYGARVMTNSLPGLAHAVEKIDVKTSTLNPIPGSLRRLVPGLPPPGPPIPVPGNVPPPHFLTAQLDALQRSAWSRTNPALRVEHEKPGMVQLPRKEFPGETGRSPAVEKEIDFEM